MVRIQNTAPSAGEDGEPWELSPLAHGKAKRSCPLGDRYAVSYKTGHTLTMWPSTCTPWCLPKWVENLCKNLHMGVDNSFIHRFRTWKQPTCPSVNECIHSGTSRQWNIIPHWKGISYPFRKRHGRSLIHTAKWKKLIWKGSQYIFQLSDILEKTKLWRQWKYSWLPGVGERKGWLGWA